MEIIEETSSNEQSAEAEEKYVVVNHEEQYSIWPDYKEVPLGWSDVGVSGSKEDCLKYIEEIWTDITPLSVRNRLKEQRNESGSV